MCVCVTAALAQAAPLGGPLAGDEWWTAVGTRFGVCRDWCKFHGAVAGTSLPEGQRPLTSLLSGAAAGQRCSIYRTWTTTVMVMIVTSAGILTRDLRHGERAPWGLNRGHSSHVRSTLGGAEHPRRPFSGASSLRCLAMNPIGDERLASCREETPERTPRAGDARHCTPTTPRKPPRCRQSTHLSD